MKIIYFVGDFFTYSLRVLNKVKKIVRFMNTVVNIYNKRIDNYFSMI